MKKENWRRVESYLEGIREFADDLYTICEDDYCDSDDEEVSPEYEEIIAVLPDTKLSLAEMLSLKETIQKWKDEHGYPNP